MPAVLVARAGLRAKSGSTPFHQRSESLGIRLGVATVAEALEVLDRVGGA